MSTAGHGLRVSEPNTWSSKSSSPREETMMAPAELASLLLAAQATGMGPFCSACLHAYYRVPQKWEP